MKILLLTNGTYHSTIDFDIKLPAYQLYWGRHYLQILKSMNMLQKKKYQVDYYIISITHGLIEHYEKVCRETFDWRGWGKQKLVSFGSEKNYREHFYQLIRNYDMACILLSKDFLYLFDFNSQDDETNDFLLSAKVKLVFFIGNGCDKLLPKYRNIIKIYSGPVEAAKYKVNLLELKSFFLKQYCTNLISNS